MNEMRNMKKTLTYNGFTGSVEREENHYLFGYVQGTKCSVFYHGHDEAELEREFRSVVDTYLAFCEREGENIKSELTYKDFIGDVAMENDGTLVGSLQNIGTLVMYVGDDMASLEKCFRETVDYYLEHCAEEGLNPYSTSQYKEYIDKPLKAAQG